MEYTSCASKKSAWELKITPLGGRWGGPVVWLSQRGFQCGQVLAGDSVNPPSAASSVLCKLVRQTWRAADFSFRPCNLQPVLLNAMFLQASTSALFSGLQKGDSRCHKAICRSQALDGPVAGGLCHCCSSDGQPLGRDRPGWVGLLASAQHLTATTEALRVYFPGASTSAWNS